MPALLEERKRKVLVENEFEYRENLKLKGFLWNFWTIRLLMPGKKQRYLVKYPSKSAVLSIEFLMEEIDLVLAEN